MLTAESLVRQLRRQGHRITPVRRALLELFAGAAAPRSVQEVLSALADQGEAVNKTTVYRELRFLCLQGIVQEVDLGEGQKRYEQASHHHHLQCASCQSVECVEADDVEEELHAWEGRLLRERGFAVTAHVLTLTGVCRRCQAGPILS